MEEVTPFLKALAAHRDRYNAQFRLARHRSKNLDANAFLEHLRVFVSPIVNAAGGDPIEVTDALMDLSLATHGRLPVSLHRVLLNQARFVGMDPARVSVALANALHHLESEPGTTTHKWITYLEYYSRSLETVESLLDLGVVLAWVCGLAALRESALDVASRLAPGTLRGFTFTDDVDQLRADPWWSPTNRGLRIVRKLGAFRGFGGTFTRPPTVFLHEGRLHATDGAHTWRVHADAYGGALRRADNATPQHQAPTLTLSRDGAVSCNGESRVFRQLAGATSWTSWSNTLAVTTPWTHSIMFVAHS
ncbi:hypothetical protein [Actinosynnema sp. ALI-1.44]|uniref:hypothetical protein n=1 Tax=Actinosynnema sp. ALI-1.44 TaxID=1933779 RepID=UPI00097BDB1D|nr:hypothetical protein [Actinosynnema sp. ALI-1.44]